MRLFGLQVLTPKDVATRFVTDLLAVERLVRGAPDQIDRVIGLGEEIAAIGYRVLEIADRLDERAEAFGELGDRLDRRAAELVALGEQLQTMGGVIDGRGAEIVATAGQVNQTVQELILVLPTLERALDLATPLEGAIDRFGRFVDRFPGASPARRRPPPEDGAD